MIGVCASGVSALRSWRNPYILRSPPPFLNDLFVQNAAWAVLLEPLLTDFLCALFIRSPLLFFPTFFFFWSRSLYVLFFSLFLVCVLSNQKIPNSFPAVVLV